MTDPFFSPSAIPRPLLEIAACTGAEFAGGPGLQVIINGAAAIGEAGPGEITFLECPGQAGLLQAAKAAACFVAREQAALLPNSTAALVVPDPYAAFLRALQELYPDQQKGGVAFAAPGVNPGAMVHPEARLEHGVIVEPGAIIGGRAEIGSETFIGASSVIGFSVRIGRNCAIESQVTISHALIGDRVMVHPGARIGQLGVRAGKDRPRARSKLPGAAPGLGRVIIQDGVEIGANAAIDRGLAGDTVIGEQTAIGTLAHIGERARIGRYCSIPAQAEIAREAAIEDHTALPRQCR